MRMMGPIKGDVEENGGDVLDFGRIGGNDTESVISVKNLSKTFKIYLRPLDMVTELFTRKKRHTDFAALDDVSIEVKRGEVLGVIGRNGAGKSTLLKIITGTLDASSGTVKVRGKVSAILELGTGFDPERTGRENIHLGGMCLGMSRGEIDRKEIAIIKFSELEEFIDRPFKTYSSGMQARLTFAVATAVDADVLIIDEALAAGDAIFVQKCLKRIKEICTSGTTVLFVSHSLHMIEDLCSQAVWLTNGKVFMEGAVDKVCKAYQQWCLEEADERNRSLNSEKMERIASAVADNKVKKQTGEAWITGVVLRDANGSVKTGFKVDETIIIDVSWEGKLPEGENLIVFYLDSTRCKQHSGYIPMGRDARFINNGGPINGSGCMRFSIKNPKLGKGDYVINAGIAYRPEQMKNAIESVYFEEGLAVFSVERNESYPMMWAYEMDVDAEEIECRHLPKYEFGVLE